MKWKNGIKNTRKLKTCKTAAENKKVAYTFWSLLPNSYQQKSGLI